MLRLSSYDHSDAYMLVKRTIINAPVPPAAAEPNNNNKEVVFQSFAPFIGCMSEINNTHTNNTKHIDVMITLYNLVEYKDNYSKTSGGLWKYYRDEIALTDADAIKTFYVGDDKIVLFKLNQIMTGKATNCGTKDSFQ